MKKSVSDCPLCLDHNAQEYYRDKLRSYLICPQCQLVFVPRSQLISIENERSRYKHHQNEADDSNYLEYLSKIEQACEPYLLKGDEGLDFGCGPSPLLGEIFSQKGFPTSSYDLFFHPNVPYKNKSYDFIILCEVIEHLRNPLEVLRELRGLSKPNGSILVRTKFYPEVSAFKDWFYKRDMTHIQFFSQTTLQHLAKSFQMEFQGEISTDLYLMKRI